MKFKIGVFGSAVDEGAKVMEKAREIGREFGKYKNRVIMVTGACSGIPYEAAYEAAKLGVEVWGYSPVTNLKEQKIFTPDDDVSIYSKIIYVPKGFEFVDKPVVCKKYRNVISTANCDGAILISGRWGTLNEFTNLYFEKVVGVLTGTGGVADELVRLWKKIKKRGVGKVIFNQSVKKLVKEVIDEVSK